MGIRSLLVEGGAVNERVTVRLLDVPKEPQKTGQDVDIVAQILVTQQ
jgi:hypothetical protein